MIGVADGVGVGNPHISSISKLSQASSGSALDIQIDSPYTNVNEPVTPEQVVPEITFGP